MKPLANGLDTQFGGKKNGCLGWVPQDQVYQDWYTKGANPGSLSATSPLAVAQYEQELNEPPPRRPASTGADAEPTAMGQRRDCGPNDGVRLSQQSHCAGLFEQGHGDGDCECQMTSKPRAWAGHPWRRGRLCCWWGDGQTVIFCRAPYLLVAKKRSPYVHRLQCCLCLQPQ